MDNLKWSDEDKSIRNKLLEKYSNNIDKKIWSIRGDYDVLDNYLEYRFRFLNECGHIRYDKDSLDCTVGSYFPETNAKYAAFNTGLRGPGNHMIWGVYEFKADAWSFIDFYAHGYDERKNGNRLDKIPVTTEDEFHFLKENGDSFFTKDNWGKVNNFYSGNLIIRSEHLLQNSNQKNRSKFLSKRLTSCFHYFMDEKKLIPPRIEDQKELIRKLIEYQLRSQEGGKMLKWGHWRWECPSNRTAKDESDFEPLSLLSPIYILTERKAMAIPDLIVPITIKKPKGAAAVFEVETVLSIEDAYKCAMLVDPYFESLWLIHDNVMEYIKEQSPKKL